VTLAVVGGVECALGWRVWRGSWRVGSETPAGFHLPPWSTWLFQIYLGVLPRGGLMRVEEFARVFVRGCCLLPSFLDPPRCLGHYPLAFFRRYPDGSPWAGFLDRTPMTSLEHGPSTGEHKDVVVVGLGLGGLSFDSPRSSHFPPDHVWSSRV